MHITHPNSPFRLINDMNIKEFQSQAQDLVSQFESLLEQIPQKGDTSDECQKVGLTNALMNLDNYINGTRQEDMVDIDTVVENGELKNDYPVADRFVEDAGVAELYEYEGVTYCVITWNETSEEHQDGDQTMVVK